MDDSMNLGLPGVTMTCTEQALLLHSVQPLDVLSCAVVGGGYTTARYILNCHVDINYDCRDPARDLIERAQALGIQESFVGLLTAVMLDRVRIASVSEQGLTVTAVVTVGVGNVTAAGQSQPAVWCPGTINTILLIDANLCASAKVKAVVTATEAKTRALHEREIHTQEGLMATGTSTDSIVIACTGRGPAWPYAGPATLPGWLIGRAVRQGILEARL